MVDVIADKYGLSHRFRAILKSSPPPTSRVREAVIPAPATNTLPNSDVEHGNGTAEMQPIRQSESPEGANHYVIARSLINFQSLDLGAECTKLKLAYHNYRC